MADCFIFFAKKTTTKTTTSALAQHPPTDQLAAFTTSAELELNCRKKRKKEKNFKQGGGFTRDESIKNDASNTRAQRECSEDEVSAHDDGDQFTPNQPTRHRLSTSGPSERTFRTFPSRRPGGVHSSVFIPPQLRRLNSSFVSFTNQ